MKSKHIFHLYAFGTSLLWSLAYVLTRICARYIPPSYLGALRVCIAALGLAALALFMKLPKPSKKDIGWFILSGASGVFLYMLCFNRGASMVTSATGNVMLAVSPAVTAIGARIIYKEKLSTLQWCSIGICFVGVVLLCMLSGGFSMNMGLMWLGLGVIFLSTYNLLQKKLGKCGYPSLSITAWSFIIGAVGFLFFLPKAVPATFGAPWYVYLLLLVLGLGCSGLAYCSWAKAFSLADKASSVSNYMFVPPFASGVLGYFMIGDPIEPGALIGGGIIMLGLVMFNFGPVIAAKIKKS